MATALPYSAMAIKKTDLKRFKKLLEDKKETLVQKAKESMAENMQMDVNELPDEMDLASSEYLHSLNFRLRGREQNLMDKIDLSLKKIEDGTFGICENCEAEIGIKRLEIRPEGGLCIRCKEEEDNQERNFA